MEKKPNTKKIIKTHIGARLDEALRSRVDRAKKTSNLSDSAFLTVALTEFLDRHPTAAERIAAVVAHKTAQAQ